MEIDKAGEKYWSGVWDETELNSKIKIKNVSISNHVHSIWHNYYSEFFKKFPIKGKTLLEVGCGNSVWLGYFAENFGAKITGMDYSDIGCKKSEMILKRDNIEGEIIQSDLFNPSDNLIEKFDIVCSFGVVEHFTETEDVIKSLLKMLKPGGLLITSVPNLMGIAGFLQKAFHRPVYDIHVPISKEYLENTLKKCGLEIVDIRYYLSVSLHVNLDPVEGKPTPYRKLKKLALKPFGYFTLLVWWIERTFGFSFPSNRFFSGGIISIAKKAEF